MSGGRVVNPLWARSPFVLRRYPGLLVAVAAGALLLALAAASSPLFLSAAGGAALGSKLDDITPYGAGLEVKNGAVLARPSAPFPGTVSPAGLARRDAALDRLIGGIPRLDPPVRTILSQPVDVAKAGVPDATRQVRILARTGALAHVQRLRGGGTGAWISDAWAKELGVRPGDRVVLANHVSFTNEVRRTTVRVAGVYRALYQEPERPYWRNLHEQIYPPTAIVPPPPTFLIVDRETALGVGRRLGPLRLELHWEYPLASAGLTLAGARDIEARLEQAQARLTDSRSPAAKTFGCLGGQGFAFRRGCETITSLDTAIGAAEADVSALRGPADLLSTAGTIVALAVVAAVGVFLVARRRNEAVLLDARGMTPVHFAAKAVVETLLPALAGGVAGYGLAVAVVMLFGPGGGVDRGALLEGARSAATFLPAGLGVLALVSAVVFLGLSGRRPRRAGLLRWVPWEGALLAAAGFCLVRLGQGHALIEEAGGVHRPSAYVLLFPIFFVGGLAALAARAFGPVLRLLRRRSRSLAPGPYLAVHRLAGAERLAVLLVAACAVSLGIFVYAQAIVHSLERSVVAKSELFVGSDVSGLVNNNQAAPAGFPLPVTKVTRVVRGAEASPQGAQVDLMAVDPGTFPDAAYWESAWSGASLEAIARRLGRSDGDALPVVLVAGPLPHASVWIDGVAIPLRVVARAAAFPGMFKGRPLVVGSFAGWRAAFERAGVGDQLATPSAETHLLVKGDEQRAAAALRASAAPPFDILTASEIRENPSIAAATRTFAFLKSLGFAAGLLAVVGMLLYLQARQRSRVVSYALSRRMGLRGRGHLGALVLELGALLLTALVIGVALALVAARIVLGDVDPLAEIPPAPLFRTPVWLLVGTGIGLAVASVLGGALAGRSAERANLAEVMRLAD